MQLSPHFTLAEMVVSQTASRLGLDNTPPPAVIAALRGLCLNLLEPVRAHFGRPVIVSSGYRAPAVNKACGGSATSQHRFGQAADFTVPGVANLELCQWIQRNLKYDQLIYEFGPSGWVHASWLDGPLRMQELSAKRMPVPNTKRTVTKYFQGLVA